MSESINVTDVGGFHLMKTLGKGAFAKVVLALKKNTKEEEKYAVKVFQKDTVLKRAKTVDLLKQEISSMRMVRHPNVVHLHEVFASKTKIYLVMDFMEGGDLYEEMHLKSHKRFKEYQARSYFQQLIYALDYCHSRGIVHRDLKLANILLDSQGNIKVADFGLSALVEHQFQGPNILLKTMCGTPVYCAPEVFKDIGYDGAKTDIWSCGVILYEMISGKLPFNDLPAVLEGKVKFPEEFPKGPKNLIKMMLQYDPAQRITITDILSHGWFKKGGDPHPAFMNETIINDSSDIEYVFDGSNESSNLVIEKREKLPFVPPQVDAFQLIAECSADNLFGRFFLDRVGRAKTDKKFVFKCPTGDIIDKIKEAATKAGLAVMKRKKKDQQNEFMYMLKADALGKKGLVSIKTDVYKLGATSDHYLLLLSKSDGDSLEYQERCTELANGLEGIIWGNKEEEHTDD